MQLRDTDRVAEYRGGTPEENTNVIVWLASYPRSGNTLLRLILEEVFAIETYSLYPEYAITYSGDGLEVRKEQLAESHDVGRIYESAHNSSRLHVVKIHSAPIDEAPAIFLERDGRAACVSYWHYLRDIQELDISLADVILGRVDYESWSEHYDAWNPRERADTLILRFEKLVEDPHYAIGEIAELLKLEPRGRFTRTFDELRQKSPKFFRRGQNAENIAELQGDDLRLFWLMHGSLMTALDYGTATSSAPTSLRELLIDHRKRTEALLEKRFEAIEFDRRRIAIQELEADRAEREAINLALEERLYASEADQREKDAALLANAADLAAIRLDRSAKEAVIERLVDELTAISQDRDSKAALVAGLIDDLAAVSQDRDAKAAVIAELVDELAAVSRDRDAKGEVIVNLENELADVRGQVIVKLAQKINRLMTKS